MLCDSILKKDKKKKLNIDRPLLAMQMILWWTRNLWKIFARFFNGLERENNSSVFFTVPSKKFEKSEFLNFSQHPLFAIFKLAKITFPFIQKSTPLSQCWRRSRHLIENTRLQREKNESRRAEERNLPPFSNCNCEDKDGGDEGSGTQQNNATDPRETHRRTYIYIHTHS